MQYPRFQPHFSVEIVRNEGVYLLCDDTCFVLRGRLYELLAPLINGRHSVDEILSFLNQDASAANVFYALNVLEQKGYIAEAVREVPESVAAFWSSLKADPKSAVTKISQTSVSIHVMGAVPSEQFFQTFQSLGFQMTSGAGFPVVITDNYLHPGLEEWNRKMIQTGTTWLLAKPIGNSIWLGPIFRPDEAGCWECLAHRLKANREIETYLGERINTSIPLPVYKAFLPSTLKIAANLVAVEFAKYIALGKSDALEGKIITLDVNSLNLQSHMLIAHPVCPACRHDSNSTAPAVPITLQSRKKHSISSSAHRALTPEQTLRKYEHLISPITGIVTDLQKRTAVGSPAHVYIAGHNFAAQYPDLKSLKKGLRSKSSGKGTSDLHAKVGGICEAIERFSGMFQGNEQRLRSNYKNFDGSAIHPNTCMQFSEQQYQQRGKINQKKIPFNFIPHPFNEDTEIDWTPVWSLTSQEIRYLPTAYCYYRYPQDPATSFYNAESNGNAAGNCIEEAILQGFMELVERDSVAIWWYNRLRKPTVELRTFEEPFFQKFENYLESINRRLWVLDLTSDLKIPSFAAISSRIDHKFQEIAFAFGSHFDAKLAIGRALTEMAQVLPLPEACEDDTSQYRFGDNYAIDWWKTATLENQPYLVPDSERRKSAGDYPQMCSEDLKDEVLCCVEIARNHGMEVLVLNQTRPETGLFVVKVIVPGLRQFWARFDNGRLYEVPVKMGWLKEPLKESELNPIPIFF